MNKNIRFDHTNTFDQSHKLMKKLLNLGFNKVKNDVEHPGKHFCSFIEFNTPNNDRAYLEFIHVGSKGVPVRNTGLSFRYEDDLESYAIKLRKRVPFEITFTHKNYDWKLNSVDKLPGWNFLEFSGIGFRTLYPWFTEYENRKGFKNIKPHKNKVSIFSGGVLSLNKKGIEFFDYILGRKISDKIEFSDGTCWLIKKARTNRISQISLTCDDLSIFPKKLHVDHDQVLIKNPNGEKFWDICIYED